jgi:hypothetical protein
VANAVTDLPDPMDIANSPSKASADDLLSQMADEAIDQLIADAEKGVSPPATVPTEVTTLPPVAPAPAVTLPSVELPPVSPQADSPAVDLPPTPEPDPVTPVIETPVGESSAATVDEETVEPHADSHVSAAESPVVIPPDRQALLDYVHDEPKPGVLLMPLQLLNAPFASLSDTARDRMGQLAIITTINAMAFILYYILFRQP